DGRLQLRGLRDGGPWGTEGSRGRSVRVRQDLRHRLRATPPQATHGVPEGYTTGKERQDPHRGQATTRSRDPANRPCASLVAEPLREEPGRQRAQLQGQVPGRPRVELAVRDGNRGCLGSRLVPGAIGISGSLVWLSCGYSTSASMPGAASIR